MIRLRPSGADEVLIKRVQDWYEPGPGVFIAPQALFNPALLFTTGVNGAWYDPSDFSTMSQDAAGTVPVTAVGQPVGRILDKSGRSNHAFNPSGNSANFPVLSARYNLLTKTEQFNDAMWLKAPGITVIANAGTAPDGGVTADRLTSSAGVYRYVYQPAALVSGVQYRLSFYVKSATGANQQFRLAYGSSGNIFSGIYTATDTWQQFSVSFTSAGSDLCAIVDSVTGAGAVGFDLLVWGADLRVANDALNQPDYQRVNTATDYDTVGFKPYLRFNGTNQWLQTNSIDFTYGDKMFVSAGVRKLSDAASSVLLETSSAFESNNGSIVIRAPRIAGASQYNAGIRISAAASVDASTYTAPISSIVSANFKSSSISISDAISVRVNSATPTSLAPTGSTPGIGNFGNHPLYIGARAGTSLFFNGRLHGLVVAGKAASASEIASTESWLNQKTGAY